VSSLVDLVGRTFGQLTVVARDGSDKNGRPRWLTRCECGRESTKAGVHLRRRMIKSCGCCSWRLPKGESGFNAVLGPYIRKAQRRGHEWALTREQTRALMALPCHYCDAPPSRIRSATGAGPKALENASFGVRWGTFTYNGIDRVDNAIGYRPENCVPCCWDCNQAKATRTVEQFFAWVERIHRKQSNRSTTGRQSA
jgi:5-methylcytosine-specific restriction endonuclease McrA